MDDLLLNTLGGITGYAFLRQPTILGGSVLAKQVYSFTKIQKKRTYKGIYGTVLGISSIVLSWAWWQRHFLQKAD